MLAARFCCSSTEDLTRKAEHADSPRVLRPLRFDAADAHGQAPVDLYAELRNICRLLNSRRGLRWNCLIFPVVVGQRGCVSRCSTLFSRQIHRPTLRQSVRTAPMGSVGVASFTTG